jgi:biotin carboxyl carrier protein
MQAGGAPRPPRLVLARTVRGVWVGWPGGARFFAREADASATASVSGTEVRAPMTGRVVQVAVAAGDRVAVDQLLVILQAMKMEYRLTAPAAGVVERVACAAGEMVDLGTMLVTLAAEPGPGGDSPP